MLLRGAVSISGIYSSIALTNVFLLSCVSSNVKIIVSWFLRIMMTFFRSCAVCSTSTTNDSMFCRGRNLVSTTSHVSRAARLMCLFFVNEKRMYPHAIKNIKIAPKRFMYRSETPITTASQIANPMNHDILLSKCSPLYTHTSIDDDRHKGIKFIQYDIMHYKVIFFHTKVSCVWCNSLFRKYFYCAANFKKYIFSPVVRH